MPEIAITHSNNDNDLYIYNVYKLKKMYLLIICMEEMHCIKITAKQNFTLLFRRKIHLIRLATGY